MSSSLATSMAADPNWLLSTSVQSTAALVGLTGGLLISRLVSLSSQRAGLQAVLRTAQRGVAERSADLDRAMLNLETAARVTEDAFAKFGPSPDGLLPVVYREAHALERSAAEARDAAVNIAVVAATEVERCAAPSGLRSAWFVLAYASMVGIVYPSILLGVGATQLSAAQRTAVVCGFLTGVVAVIIYLWRSIQSLSSPAEPQGERVGPPRRFALVASGVRRPRSEGRPQR